MAITFTRAANLRGLIRDRLLPASASQLYKLLEPFMATSYNGALETESEAVGSRDMLVFPESLTPDAEFQAWARESAERKQAAKDLRKLLGWKAPETQMCTHLFHRGATYSPIPSPTTSPMGTDWGDCNVQYRRADGSLKAGRILHIVNRGKLSSETKTSANTKVVIQNYKALSSEEVAADNFRAWPVFGGHLVHAAFDPRPEVIAAQDIVAHVATCPFRDTTGATNDTYIVIWPLDRVSLLYIADRRNLTLGVPDLRLATCNSNHMGTILALLEQGLETGAATWARLL